MPKLPESDDFESFDALNFMMNSRNRMKYIFFYMVYLHLTFTEDILASLLQCLFLAFAFFRHALPLCSSSLSAKVMLCLLSSEYQLPFSGVSDKVILLKNSL